MVRPRTLKKIRKKSIRKLQRTRRYGGLAFMDYGMDNQLEILDIINKVYPDIDIDTWLNTGKESIYFFNKILTDLKRKKIVEKYNLYEKINKYLNKYKKYLSKTHGIDVDIERVNSGSIDLNPRKFTQTGK